MVLHQMREWGACQQGYMPNHWKEMPQVWASESLCLYVQGCDQQQEGQASQCSGVRAADQHTLWVSRRGVFRRCIFVPAAGRKVTESNCCHSHQWHSHQFTLGHTGWRDSTRVATKKHYGKLWVNCPLKHTSVAIRSYSGEGQGLVLPVLGKFTATLAWGEKRAQSRCM